MVKEDEGNATNGDQQDSVQKETAVVTATHQSRLLTLNRTKMVKSLRERRISEVGGILGTYLGNRAKTTSRVSARDRHVILGILPNVRVTRNHQGADSAKSVLSRPTG